MPSPRSVSLQGKLKKSLDDFDDALKLRPEEASSLYGRGQAQLALGHVQAGQADLAAARRQQPEIDARLKCDGMPTTSAADRPPATEP